MKSPGELLEIACHRIADTDRPAYVKNSDLRYIAVNDAYAKFFGREISDFIGCRSHELSNSTEDSDREDKERRAIVFGTEETSTCFDREHRTAFEVQIESFMPSDDRAYVFGIFAVAPPSNVLVKAIDASAETDLARLHAELEYLPHPINITAEDGRTMKEREILLRKHTDEAALYRTILHDLPVAAFVRDADHRLVYANEAYFSLTGLTREASLGKTEHEMFGEDAQALFAENEAILREKRAYDYESEVVDQQQRAHALVTRVNSVSTSDARQYIVGSMTDVSTLKQRETQLIETQARAEQLRADLENILESMPAGVMIIDKNFDLEYANDAFYAIWGLSKDDRLEGKTLRELMRRNYARGHYGADAGDFEAVYQARIEAICRPGAHLQSEISFGEDRRVVLDARQISEGRILLSYVDISSLRRQEQALSDGRQALARLGELMAEATHAMSQGLLIVEHDVILLSNDALSAMLQIPAAWLAAGQNWVEALRQCAVRGDLGADWEAILAEWTAKVARRQPISAALHVAGERWIQMDASMSAADRWLVVFTDVTETKDREKELQRLLARSEAADRAKSEFLANMSHEIRTPMNGVLGMAELLTKTGLDARQKTFVDIIAKSGNALLTIINDILDFSKIDAGQMRLRKAAFDPVEAIEDVATLLSSQAGEKNIELLVRASPLLPPMVLGDAGRFRQILTNLVGNAVKFTEHGHVLIDIDAGQTPDGATMVTVAVADTGVGISKERLDSIFDKFSQVDSSSTRRHEGTGLGLAITAGLVDLFGGYLEVDSVIGSGSVFKVHLPLPPAVGRREQKLVPVNVSGARILVIDDNEINRQILTEQLSIWGFEGLAVADGPSGLAILDAAFDMGVPVDAIILDYHMPDMNGAEVARTLRQDSRFDAVPLIFLTSMDVAGSDREFAALGGDAHLMKPARANVLRNTVIEVVRASRQPQVAGGQIRSKTFATGDGDVPKSTGAAVTAGRSDATVDILVAEDNEVNQIVFTQILQAAGAHFLVVKNGEEAVAAYRQHMPGLIMMDVSMPVMNGLQATRAIRRIETDSGRRVPIIGVTAHAMESDRDACLEAGMDDYMSKPISPELLEAKITRWLKSFGSESSRSHR